MGVRFMGLFKYFAGLSVSLTFAASASAQSVVDTRPELYRLISHNSTVFKGDSILVAVIDSGVDYTHPLIKNHLWVNQAEAQGVEGIDDDKNGFVDDIHGWNFAHSLPKAIYDEGHGTATAGIISSEIGIAPKAQILDLQALFGRDQKENDFIISKGTGRTSDIIAAIKYALKAGAQIINLSLSADETFLQQLHEAIPTAELNKALIVVAGGNSNLPLKNTNSYSNVIVVGAATLNEVNTRRAYYSNYGPGIDIAAPAGDSLGNFTLAITRRGLYRNYNGTSSAAPVVSAAAALKLEQSPSLKPHELKKLILDSASRLRLLQDEVVEGRLLNIEALLRADSPRR